jgi:hypothetical protein
LPIADSRLAVQHTAIIQMREAPENLTLHFLSSCPLVSSHP